jgi:hypothetical protein
LEDIIVKESLLIVFLVLIIGQSHACQPVFRTPDQIENSFLGVQTYLNFTGRLPNDNDYAVMDSMASIGIKWVRYWLCWYQVEVDSGNYDFTAADSVIQGYASRGMNVYLTLLSGNQWYDGPDSTIYDSVAHPEQGISPTQGTASMQGWLNFVEAAVLRYSNYVKYWDIWNEPNIDFWQPAPDAQDYAYLLKMTSQAIKSIDPGAKVIGLGTSTIDFGFISEVLQEDIISDIDYLGFHPYRYYPEDDQDNMGLWYPPDAYMNYDEELQGLLDTLIQYDTSGRVRLWDEEAGFPSHPECFIWTPDTIYISDITQAKYLLRRFILNLGFNVSMTTWFCDWDQVSAYPSILGPVWYQHYYDMNVYEKEVSFPFSYLGLTHSLPADTILIEAEAYDSLYPPLKDGGTYLYTNDGDGDLQGSAVYYVDIPDSGLYTVWLRMRNPDESACFVIYLDDSIPHWASNALSSGTDTLFIWSLPMDAELIRWHYLFRGRHFFDLSAGLHCLRIQTGLDGGSLDKIVIKKEEPELSRKPGFSALQNLAAVFDNQILPDPLLGTDFDNIDAPVNEYNELRYFCFRDTSSDRSIIAYWLGLKIISDNYPVYNNKLTVYTDSVFDPIIINLMDGAVLPVTNYTATDTSVIFDSLPVSDHPFCLVMDHYPGITETDKKTGGLLVSLSPNPFTNSVRICLNRDPGLEITSQCLGNIDLGIFDISGSLVKSYTITSTQNSMHIFWDGRDNRGKKLASGVYFLYITTEDREDRVKILLIK